MIFIGIDPGKSGGIAWIEGGEAAAAKAPATERDQWELLVQLAGLLTPGSHAVIEEVHAMPKQGVTSMFSFGQNYGTWIGMLTAAAIPFDLVTPQTWQRVLRCRTRGDKNVSKRRAQQLFPQLKITHATADALLIAEYCRLVHGDGNPKE